MESGILIRWGAPKSGRERESLELYRKSVAFFRRLVDQGKLTSFEPFFLMTGDSEVENGGFLVRGPVTEIFALLDNEEFRETGNRISLAAEHVRMDMITVGDSIDRGIADYEKALSSARA